MSDNEDDDLPVVVRKVSFEKFYDMDRDSELGKGAFAVVRKCTQKETGEEYAAKEFFANSRKQKEKFKKEAEIFKRLSNPHHPNVVRLIDAIQTHSLLISKTQLYLIFELVPGGELFDYIVEQKKLSEHVAATFFVQILSAIEFCHQRDVLHRDVKPENLLMSSTTFKAGEKPTVKLADLGLGVPVEGNKQIKFESIAGTPLYMAPEILQSKAYGKLVDLWACGVVLCCILFGYMPYSATQEKELAKGGQLKLEYGKNWENLTEDARDIIQRLLSVDPEKRISAEEALKHPWIAQRNERASMSQRPEALTELRNFNAKRKMKAAITVTQIAYSLSKASSKEHLC